MRRKVDVFLEITARWHLTPAERRALLGSLTDERWIHLAHDAVPALTPELFARIRGVIQIDAALSSSVSDPRERAHWMRTIELAAPFFGRTPLALMFRGIEGFKAVAEYLAPPRPATRTSNVH